MRALLPTYRVLGSLTLVFAAIACSLNPQPIPPGDQPLEQPDGSFGDNSPTAGGAADASDDRMNATSDSSDVGIGPPAPDDAGDAGDAAADAGDAAIE